MAEEKIGREDFDALWGAFLAFARQLREKDRHGRGGTTIDEALQGGAFGEALIEILTDPLYISHQVKRHLEWWLGERDVWGGHPSPFLSEGYQPGIAMLGKTKGMDGVFSEPEELARRASRAMSDEKAIGRIMELEELGALCLDLAAAFEERLDGEGG
jgi:hypothetical protein